MYDVTVDRLASASTDENNLISYLFDQHDYNPLIRPVKNRSETIDVFFEMALIQLISLVRHIVGVLYTLLFCLKILFVFIIFLFKFSRDRIISFYSLLSLKS